MVFAASNPRTTGYLSSSTLLCAINLLSLSVLFKAYNSRNATQEMFLIGTFISVGSMFQYAFLPMIVPYVASAIMMKAFRIKEALATGMGLIAPYWVGVGMGLIPLEAFSLPELTNLFSDYIHSSDLFVFAPQCRRDHIHSSYSRPQQRHKAICRKLPHKRPQHVNLLHRRHLHNLHHNRLLQHDGLHHHPLLHPCRADCQPLRPLALPPRMARSHPPRPHLHSLLHHPPPNLTPAKPSIPSPYKSPPAKASITKARSQAKAQPQKNSSPESHHWLQSPCPRLRPFPKKHRQSPQIKNPPHQKNEIHNRQ